MTLPRRELLKSGGWLALFAAGHSGRFGLPVVSGQDSTKTVALPPLNRFSRMIQEWLVDRVREIEAQGNARRAALQTKADAEAYVKSVQDRIREAFGPEPERTPLHARITGVLERETYRIEKVLFESRPGMLVSANLYIPQGRKFPLPAVVGSCGHSANGKAGETYQSFAQGPAVRTAEHQWPTWNHSGTPAGNTGPDCDPVPEKERELNPQPPTWS